MAMDSLREVLRERRRWSAYLLTFDSSEALDAFLVIEDDLDPPDYWRLLGDAWNAAEAVQANEETWRRLFSSDRPNREMLMTEAERPLLEALPDEVTIYRGHSHDGGARGLAWTLERDSAVRFAHQFATSTDMGHPPGDPRLATATVSRSAILAVFRARQAHREGGVVVLDLPAEIDVESL